MTRTGDRTDGHPDGSERDGGAAIDGDDGRPGAPGEAAAQGSAGRSRVAADLRRVARRGDTRDPPTISDYRAHGGWGVALVRRWFDSWPAALDAAGLDGDAARERRVGGGARRATPDALREDVRRVAAREDTSDPPTKREYDAHGEWVAETAARRLGDGSWVVALDVAGVDTGDADPRECVARRSPGAAAVAEDIRRVAAREDTSDPPTKREYETHGEWSARSASKRLGSWADALDAAGLDGDTARERQGGNETRSPTGAVAEDIRRVAAREDTSDPPTQVEYATRGAHGLADVHHRFGSWPDALEAAGVERAGGGDAAGRGSAAGAGGGGASDARGTSEGDRDGGAGRAGDWSLGAGGRTPDGDE